MIKILSGALLLAVFLSGCCRPNATIGSQAVNLHAQKTNMWCWAASGQMVMEFLGVNVTQCDEANKRFGKSNCCNSPTPNECVQGGWPEFDKYGFTFAKTSDAPLSWASLQEQIYCQRKPFAFAWHWTGGGGHMMVATGYAVIAGTNYVAVNNPWPPRTSRTAGGDQYLTTYTDYVSGSDHTHWDDYYNVTKQ
jgi:papain like cysteine protease AvrRpt2